jgi:NAD(P)-dependent dehydrogenase (short-subunit alcohol dehydrogenase family)
MQELAGKVAIITGGAKGIGEGTVELFVEEGAKVVIADVDAESGEALAARLGPSARFKRTDVSRREDVQAVVDYAIAEFGGLHVMMNNAAITENKYARLLERDFDNFDTLMRINVLGVMLGVQIAGRHMAKNGGGSIINTSSIGGVMGGFGFELYRASKAALFSFTHCAAIDLGEYLVRVNTICPGNIPTKMGAFSRAEPGSDQAAMEDRIRDAILDVRMSRQPLKRVGGPRDIGQLALFLASDRSQYMTGQIISSDGGATAGDAKSVIAEVLEARERAIRGG